MTKLQTKFKSFRGMRESCCVTLPMDVTLDVKYKMIPDSSATDTFFVSHDF